MTWHNRAHEEQQLPASGGKGTDEKINSGLTGKTKLGPALSRCAVQSCTEPGVHKCFPGPLLTPHHCGLKSFRRDLVKSGAIWVALETGIPSHTVCSENAGKPSRESRPVNSEVLSLWVKNPLGVERPLHGVT